MPIIKDISLLDKILFFLNPNPKKYDKIKHDVISYISLGKKFIIVDDSNYVVDGKKIHVRFSIQNRFSITPPDKESDYTLWIISSKDCYYLIPNIVVNEIHENPISYVGKHYGYKVVNINIETNMCKFSPEKPIDLSSYRNEFLPNLK